MSHIVVLGCHGRKEPWRQGIAKLVKRFTSEMEVRYDVRGLVARVHFGFNGIATPAQRAQSFFQDVISHQTSATYWAKVDEPRTLRDLKARARSLGEAFVEFCSLRRSGTHMLQYLIVNGFLVVGDVVVALLTLLPGDECYGQVVPSIGKVVLDANHRPVNYKNPLGTQLCRGIAGILVKLHQKPAFIDTAEEVLSNRSSERTVPVTQQPPQHNAPDSDSSVGSSPNSDSGSSSSQDAVASSPAETQTRKRKRKMKQGPKRQQKNTVPPPVSKARKPINRPKRARVDSNKLLKEMQSLYDEYDSCQPASAASSNRESTPSAAAVETGGFGAMVS
jgi:hypothetical protein